MLRIIFVKKFSVGTMQDGANRSSVNTIMMVFIIIIIVNIT